MAAANNVDYRISNPRIEGNTVALPISGIHVFIKGATAAGVGVESIGQGNLWDTFATPFTVSAAPLATIPSATTPFTSAVINSQALNLPVTPGLTSPDMITVGFNSL